MAGNGHTANASSQVPNTRVGRFLRERELRRCEGARDKGVENPEHDRPYSEEAGSSISQEVGCGDKRPLKQRLLVVANRLPLRAVRENDGSWSLEISAGGLVSALRGVTQFEIRWIGWPGVNPSDQVDRAALTRVLAEKKCIPVFLDEEIFNEYYNGYCNNILWPLFHYLGLPKEERLATTKTFQSQFAAYERANKMFADVINEIYEEDDIVWCHDYHLMFLPKYLKEHNTTMKVGWFLHTPFPSSEIHRTLPSRSEVLRAVLAADLVGFHNYDYARHFVSACTRILGLEGTPEGVEDQGRLTRVAAFPVGLTPDRFICALENQSVQDNIETLKRKFDGIKVVLGVDRLDMIKGLPQKILGFEKFLEENPEWHGKVILVQVAVPTRTEVPEYQKLTSQVHEIVGRINGRFGTLTGVPIHHLDCSLDFETLCALYAVTDIALVTSLRDGMNLVSYEFVACQNSKKGVLILSEFAGASQSLGAGAILVNPWNAIEVAYAIRKALTMPAEEREKRHQLNFHHVITHTAQKWVELFVSELNDSVIEARQRITKVPPPLAIGHCIERYVESKNRLLILGFNCVLTEPIDSSEGRGDQIKEMELKLHPDLKEPLRILSSDPRTTILVLSGSERAVLDKNFSNYNMWLAAENGVFFRSTEGEWTRTVRDPLNMDWVNSVKDVFEYFTERTPRSHIVMRETSLAWNYKYADVEFGKLQVRDMLEHLWTSPIASSSVDIVQGSRSVEVRPIGITKGATIGYILVEIGSKAIPPPIDYILCLGNFLGKDEDVYTFFEPNLPIKPSSRSSSSGLDVVDLKSENYFSCTVGEKTNSTARYVVSSSTDAITLLQQMAVTHQVAET